MIARSQLSTTLDYVSGIERLANIGYSLLNVRISYVRTIVVWWRRFKPQFGVDGDFRDHLRLSAIKQGNCLVGGACKVIMLQ